MCSYWAPESVLFYVLVCCARVLGLYVLVCWPLCAFVLGSTEGSILLEWPVEWSFSGLIRLHVLSNGLVTDLFLVSGLLSVRLYLLATSFSVGAIQWYVPPLECSAPYHLRSSVRKCTSGDDEIGYTKYTKSAI